MEDDGGGVVGKVDLTVEGEGKVEVEAETGAKGAGAIATADGPEEDDEGSATTRSNSNSSSMSSGSEEGGGSIAASAALGEGEVKVEMSEEVREVSQETKDQANALKEEGNEFLKAGKFIPAVEKYSAAIELVPSAVFHSNRAVAYLKLENYGLAISDADEAMRLDPSYLKAYYRRASAHLALGHYKVALKDFRYVVKQRPNDKEARAQYKACEKASKEAAFAAAIESEDDVPLAERLDPATISVDPAYDGPRLSDDGNVTAEFISELLVHLKEQKLLHKKYMVMVLGQCYTMFKAMPSLMRLQLPDDGEDSHLTVCGDTHGQFYDVLNIFEINGLPSRSNPYLFNGDFVDRGSFSVEVVLTLFAMKLACPEGLFLTRGNHESKNMNKMYGFEGEVKHKYDDTVMTLFTEVFNWLPLAGTINDKVFVVHGGLPSADNVTLNDISKIPRKREPPDSGLMSDLMWSDPQPFPGRSPSKRGVGMAFGADVTEAFLTHNGLELLVRSHEVKEEGYLVEHGGKCITVFSAPNYCDQMGNKGAFIKFGSSMEPNFTQFEAVPHPSIRPMAYTQGFRNFGL